jgi:imidazolonepropionase-like amidohydrolase
MRTGLLPVATLASIAVVSLAAQSSSIVAIQGARIVPVQGRPIEIGTIVIRDGLIAAVGAKEAVPAGATVIPGKGLTVYPGLIDMGSTTGLDMPAVPRAENPQTSEDVERVKAEYLRRAHLRAADYVNPNQLSLARAAAAGITSVLATPGGDAFRGQSALIGTALWPDEPQIGALADARKGALVIKSPVALHVTFSERPAGSNAYPNSLMGVIAFVRQSFLDAQHAQAAERYASNTAVPAARRLVARPPYDAATATLQEALARRLPVAFRGEASREILRALDMAKTFKLETVITGAREADLVATDLKTADARVILSLDYPRRSESLAPDADEPLGALRARANAPKTAAALAKAGVPFAFESGSLSEPRDFIRNAARAVQHGLSRDDAVRALTLAAAIVAGAADRVGSLEAGKIANLLVTEGDLFDDKMAIKHVFVEGRAVNLDVPAASDNRRTP